MDGEGRRLAEVVKETHKRLRKRCRQGEDEAEVWKDHIQHEDVLRTYASAMHNLATNHWESTQQINTSRVTWVNNAVIQYYQKGEMTRVTQKELRKLTYLGLETECDTSDGCLRKEHEKLQLLDVGSCYNPFSVYEQYEVTAVDLYPAQPSVKQCDFLDVELTEEATPPKNEGKNSNESGERESSLEALETASESAKSEVDRVVSSVEKDQKSTPNSESDEKIDTDLQTSESVTSISKSESDANVKEKGSEEMNKKSDKSNTIRFLRKGFFDVVVFCLLLEYLPSPKQRFRCCEKAYNLLKPNGLLCIITPDSKHQNANVHLYKLWKITLGFLGFSRIKYEKQTHFHGMVFRKGLCKRAWELDSDRELSSIKTTNVKSRFETISYDKIKFEMYIPQDFQDLSDSDEELPEKCMKLS
ncbi:S-adenosylmethionine sensor upstream of mTORC1-like isoform X1 [Penaeus monodon]|uniref:S-adenosylmethionine sensor upstream of mTORC1-like isoform X1 n=1 Tax=Penaeus monodon TaxID=6687 RepID=UPI0018A7685E|nr:S-adenosylmethionine sensor upstream of mTORC1-like isoform X1 [Penaeus monodon]